MTKISATFYVTFPPNRNQKQNKINIKIIIRIKFLNSKNNVILFPRILLTKSDKKFSACTNIIFKGPLGIYIMTITHHLFY